jgi:hypothetical protein
MLVRGFLAAGVDILPGCHAHVGGRSDLATTDPLRPSTPIAE